MKKIIRSIILLSLCFGLVVSLIPGFEFDSAQTLVTASFIFGILGVLLKPLIDALLTPLNFITLGLLKPLTNIAFIYALTFFIPSFKVNSFQFEGFTYSSIVLPPFFFNIILTLVVSSFFIYLLNSLLEWFLT